MTPLARKENLVVQSSGDEVLVYDLEKNKAAALNDTSALIWQSCDGNNDVIEIAAIVEKKFGGSVNEDFVKLALSQLSKENLLENEKEVLTGFNGLSRREVIRKVGFSSMVALPLVSAIIAPTAAHAQSVCLAASGICVQAGGNICAGCSIVINLDFHPSTDGSCTGGVASMGSVNCVSNPVFISAGQDVTTSP